MKPIKKFQTAGIAGTLGVIVLYLANQAGIEMTPEVAAALAVVATWLAGYLQRDPTVVAGKEKQNTGDPATE
jgi:putative flippase GtrA